MPASTNWLPSRMCGRGDTYVQLVRPWIERRAKAQIHTGGWWDLATYDELYLRFERSLVPAERDELFKDFARALFRGDMDALYEVVTPDFLWKRISPLKAWAHIVAYCTRLDEPSCDYHQIKLSLVLAS